MPTAAAPGPALAHIRRGTGPPLLLLPGIGVRHQSWAPVLDRLAAERDVVALDLPGFGASPALPAGIAPTVEALAQAVGAFCDALWLERPHVAGNSLGGAIALELGRTGRARSVTALSPIGFQRGRERSFLDASLRATRAAARRRPVAGLLRTAAGRAVLGGQMYARPWRVPPAVSVADLRAVADAPAFDAARPHVVAWTWRAGDLDVPVTIAWGERDRLLLPRQAGRARRAMPGAHHVALTGCGHIPSWDDPGQVATVVLAGSRE